MHVIKMLHEKDITLVLHVLHDNAS